MSLKQYHQKRHFDRTPEPQGGRIVPSRYHYVIQKHAASRLHYDFRLELDGVLKSWAIPKGPSLDPTVKRLAIHVEDHPVEYGSFEGIIPKGEYGGGTVMLWDRGTWKPRGDPRNGYEQGKLKFALEGERLQGGWTLARMKTRGKESGEPWLLMKEKDAYANSSDDTPDKFQVSIASGLTMEKIAAQEKQVWSSNRPTKISKSTKGEPTKRTTPARSASSLPEARKAVMPSVFKPQLATLVDKAPSGEDWVHEIKFDGYRMLCFIRKGRARFVTRNGLDWTNKFPTLVDAVSRLSLQDAILDGEIVALRDNGTADFQALQNVLNGDQEKGLFYYLFDLPYYEGYDLTRTPLLERKVLLQELLAKHQGESSPLRYTEHIQGKGESVFLNACRLAAEGIVSKQIAGPYVQKRSRYWLKVKCIKRQEFVIGGYTDPGGSRAGLGALLIGYYDGLKQLRYAGRVGTGFTERTLQDLLKQLRPREMRTMPFADFPRGLSRQGIHWTRPELVAEVAFTEWTSDSILRHPSFQGLRTDKPAKQVVRESSVQVEQKLPATPKKASQTAARKPNRPPESSPVIRITNPDRVLYPEQGITKQGLAQYYEAVAAWILPHIIRRPLTIVRCPEGHQKSCFYQKHLTEGLPDSIRGIKVKEKHGSMTTLVIDDLQGLIGLVQMGVLEIHPWGCRENQLDKPDRLVFDLDPAPDVSVGDLIKAAQLLRSVLKELGLTSFVKTTGGKGLHVVSPLTPRASWDEVKQFSKTLAGMLAKHSPDRYIDVMTKSKRAGKIFVDYLRNGYGATSVAPYSTRARAGAPVSTPLEWKELVPKLQLGSWNLRTVPQRLARLKQDPWSGFFDVRQSVTQVMQRHVAKVMQEVLLHVPSA